MPATETEAKRTARGLELNVAAQIQTRRFTKTTAVEELQYANGGVSRMRCFCEMSASGRQLRTRSIVSTITAITNREIAGGQPETNKQETRVATSISQ
jgi:hypothetical protein